MIPNPWVLLAIGLAWLASVAGVGYWQRQDGATGATAECLAAKNDDLVKARAEIARLTKAKDADEQTHAAALAIAASGYEKDRQDAEDQHRRDVDALNAGALRLRIAGACHGLPATAGSQAAPAAAAGRSDGATDAELPGPIAQALLDIGHDADDVTRQLGLCQKTALAYYNACSSKGVSP